VASSVADIEDAHRTGRIAMVPSIEGAAPIENESIGSTCSTASGCACSA
jgi:hypothetical protein